MDEHEALMLEGQAAVDQIEAQIDDGLDDLRTTMDAEPRYWRDHDYANAKLALWLVIEQAMQRQTRRLEAERTP